VNSHEISILYLGRDRGTSLDRANALRRLGHRVEHVDLRQLLPNSAWIDRVTWHLGGSILSPWILRGLRHTLKRKRYDLCYVDSGEWASPRVVEWLRTRAGRIVNYNIDDPLGGRDRARFAAYRASLPLYDLCVVMRTQNVAEAQALGVRRVLHMFRSADEVTHAPRPLTDDDRSKWKADVLFLGTWLPERGPFLLDLANRGIPLTIRGANWHKAPEWRDLQRLWAGGQIEGDDYAKAIQCAKVSLGLLSKGNRDLHTTRSLEIPALGGLLCAERTSEHLQMYREGLEALFWEGGEECAAMCRNVLEDNALGRRIAAAGRIRCIANGSYNERGMNAIVEDVFPASVKRG